VETAQSQPDSTPFALETVPADAALEPATSELGVIESAPSEILASASIPAAEILTESTADADATDRRTPDDTTDAPAVPVASENTELVPVEPVAEQGEPDSQSAAITDAVPEPPEAAITTAAISNQAAPTEPSPETVVPPIAEQPPTTASPVEPADNSNTHSDSEQPPLPEGPVVLPANDNPKYTFDYRGRLWVEKKNKGFFRQLRRPQLPPDDPQSTSNR
jgi:hypothetical protein